MLKRDVIATFSGTTASTILALASAIIIARVLGPEHQGLLALALLLPMTLDKFALVGQDLVNSTFAGLHKEQRGSLFLHSIFFTVVGGAIAVVCILAFYYWLPIQRGRYSEISNDIVLLTCLYAPLSLFNSLLMSLLRGVGRVSKAAGLMVVLSGINLVLAIILLWWLRFGLATAVAIATITPVFSIILAIWTLRDYATLRPSAFSWSLMRKSLSFGGLISLSTLASFLIYRLAQFMLAYMVEAAEVGLFAVAIALAERLRLLPDAVSTAFLPRLANEAAERQGQVPMVFRQTLLISLFSMLLAGIFGIPAIYILYGPAYAGSILPFLILLPGIAALGGAAILAADLMVRNRPGYSVRVGYSMLAANVLLNLLLIPRAGISGAAIANLLSYLGAALLWTIFYCRESRQGVGVLIPRWSDAASIVRTGIGVIRRLRGGRGKSPTPVPQVQKR
jgi:stage V sporulation protein B